MPYRYEVKKLKKFSEICRKSDFAGQCYAEEEKISIIFAFNLANDTFISLYGAKEELDYFCGYGSKSTFSVQIWNERSIFNRMLEQEEKIKFFSNKLYKSSFGGQCYAKRRKSTNDCQNEPFHLY